MEPGCPGASPHASPCAGACTELRPQSAQHQVVRRAAGVAPPPCIAECRDVCVVRGGSRAVVVRGGSRAGALHWSLRAACLGPDTPAVAAPSWERSDGVQPSSCLDLAATLPLALPLHSTLLLAFFAVRALAATHSPPPRHAPAAAFLPLPAQTLCRSPFLFPPTCSCSNIPLPRPAASIPPSAHCRFRSVLTAVLSPAPSPPLCCRHPPAKETGLPAPAE